MKAILEFDLNDVDDVISHKHALAGEKLAFVITDLDEKLRGVVKYGYEEGKYTPLERPAIENYADSLRSWLREELADKGILLDSLY